jgi:ABC-2 type transport system ATP-binding protein
MDNETILEVRGLAKTFGPVHAVEQVDLAVRRGRIYGFLGPNGSGKTTTIGMILSLIWPTRGEIRLFGKPVTPLQNGALSRVGALVGTPALVPYLSARENLRVVSKLHSGIGEDEVRAALASVDLTEAADRAAGKYSTGMKQRLGLAIALLHKPELLVLDEPTNGMDPAGMREIRELLRSLAVGGMAVFLSSHLLHEVELICDEVTILSRGRVVAQGDVQGLMGNQRDQIRMRVPSPAEAAALLLTMPGVASAVPNGAYVTVQGVTGDAAVKWLAGRNIFPGEVLTEKPDLERYFLELTGNRPD